FLPAERDAPGPPSRGPTKGGAAALRPPRGDSGRLLPAAGARPPRGPPREHEHRRPSPSAGPLPPPPAAGGPRPSRDASAAAPASSGEAARPPLDPEEVRDMQQSFRRMQEDIATAMHGTTRSPRPAAGPPVQRPPQGRRAAAPTPRQGRGGATPGGRSDRHRGVEGVEASGEASRLAIALSVSVASSVLIQVPTLISQEDVEVAFAEEGGTKEYPVALAQTQVTLWKKWKPDRGEYKAALAKLKQAKAQVLTAKSLEQQAQPLSDQLSVQRQKLEPQKQEAIELVDRIVKAESKAIADGQPVHIPAAAGLDDPKDGKTAAVDQTQGLVRSAAALEQIAEGVVKVQGASGPDAKMAGAAAAGLSETSRNLLATIGQLQDDVGHQVLVAGDFSQAPSKLTETEFLPRSTMSAIAPPTATFRTED
ncbi:unnamed protein product, partial [Prorocentrum cordatum]